jgi:osmotically-inducible protein OsmY
VFDDDVCRRVETLSWQLRVAGRAITVSADDGAVTLLGTVRNVRQKLLAETSARAVPTSVEVEVSDGIVTLTGSAMYTFERDEAERAASNITGVIWVNDAITLSGWVSQP